MNAEKIGKDIAKRILFEEFTEKVVLYPGAFKPPHRGHVATILGSNDESVDKYVVFVSTKSREDVDIEESIKTWNLYKQTIPGMENVEFVPTATPVKAVYDYVKDNSTHDIRAVYGKGEGDRFNRLLDPEKYPNVEIYDAGTEGDYSARNLRQAMRDKDINKIQTFIPAEVNPDSFLNIFQNEAINEIGDLSQAPYKWSYLPDNSDEYNKEYSFTTKDSKYSVIFYMNKTGDNWDLEFLASTGIGGSSTRTLTGGNEPLKIMSTVVDIVKDFLKQASTRIKTISYSPTKGKQGEKDAEDNTRAKLYKIIIQKNFPKAKISGGDDVTIDVSAYSNKAISESIVGKKIVCDNCGWEWEIADGGDDMFTCHKCGSDDNQPIVKNKNYLQEARYKRFLNESWDNNKAHTINHFTDYATNYLSIDRPSIKLITDPQYTQQYHSFGGYMPSNNNISVVVHNRNMADILRTLAHELVHHMQNLDDRLEDNSGEDGSPEENEANSLAAVIMRQYGRDNTNIYE